MKHGLWVLLCVVGVSAPSLGYAVSNEEADRIHYGGDWYDNHREITYWGQLHLGIMDYHYGSDDAKHLKLVVKEKKLEGRPRDDIQLYFMNEFKKFFGDLPFRDLDQGRDERFRKFLDERLGQFSHDDYEQFEASEEARRRSLYGGRAGAIFCNLRVKRSEFPVLYVIECSLSADLRYDHSTEVRDIGFSSPEHIAGEIKRALTDKLKELSTYMAKIRKYGK